LNPKSIISEIEEVIEISSKDYSKFCNNFLAVRTVERNLEIIGEAARRMLHVDPLLQISSTMDIIGLRNILAHAYDAIEPTTLWKIIIKYLLILKDEIGKIKG
jgi:uncharacterized protein with HEPN domain